MVYSISYITDVTEFCQAKGQPSWSVIELLENGDRIFHIGSEGALSHTRSILTRRELDIIRWATKGLTSRKIAEVVNLSYETVLSHRKNILRKTNSSSMAEAVSFCIQQGFV